MRQPTLFIPHGGGPCFFMDWQPPQTWVKHRDFLAGLPALLPERPRALLVISAHWECARLTVQRQQAPSLLFDYVGFPPHTYQLSWPAPGAPVLAEKVAALLDAAGLPCGFDEARGFDHGVFVPLKVAFPEADIPCVQLSLHAGLDPALHLAVGQALAPLRDEGVLILGSGNTYHNLPVMLGAAHDPSGPVHGMAFDRWLTETIELDDPDARHQRLLAWAQAPGARDAAPREEHLLPLFVAAGAGGADKARRIFRDVVLGAVQSAFRFG